MTNPETPAPMTDSELMEAVIGEYIDARKIDGASHSDALRRALEWGLSRPRHRSSPSTAAGGWQAIEVFDGRDVLDRVDLWMSWGASPLTMGMADSFRVPDCWKRGGSWYHHHMGKEAMLNNLYITHFRPLPEPPK